MTATQNSSSRESNVVISTYDVIDNTTDDNSDYFYDYDYYYYHYYYFTTRQPLSMYIESDAYIYVINNLEFLTDLQLTYLPLSCSGFVISFNLYLLLCLCLVKELRAVRSLLIFWQGFCDIISVAVVDIIAFTLPNTDWFWKLHRYDWFGKILYFNSCHLLGVGQIINEYSTGFVLSFYAFERLVLIFFPFSAQSLLTKKFYIVTFLTVIIIDLTLWTNHAIAIHRGREDSCNFLVYQSFWPNPKAKLWGDMTIFFVIPASFCFIAYALIGVRFIQRLTVHRRQNSGTRNRNTTLLTAAEKRNITLTICFLTSTFVWIVFWSIFYYARYLDFELANGDAYYFQWGYFKLFAWLFDKFVFNVYSAINPFLFLTINKSFQKPLLWLGKRILRFVFWAFKIQRRSSTPIGIETATMDSHQ